MCLIAYSFQKNIYSQNLLFFFSIKYIYLIFDKKNIF